MAFASNQTSNYGLCQWKETDLVVHTDFNEDNQKIDTALARKAEQGDLSALTDRVAAVESGKADQTALEEVETGAARATYGLYRGSGKYGSANPRTISFSSSIERVPKLVIIRPTEGEGDALVLINGITSTMCNLSGTYSTSNKVTVSWSGNRVSWYAENPRAQMEETDVIYHFFAIG